MRYISFTIALLLSTLVILSGCTQIGPNYAPPEVPLESNWVAAENENVSVAPPVDPKWWNSAFNDPELDKLVQSAINQNLTLRSAALRVLQAQQQLAIAIGNQFPQEQQVSSSTSRQKANSNTFNEYSLGFNVGWEIDLWGRFGRQVESATADLDASVASYDSALVSLAAQVANNYMLIRTFQRRLEVARTNIGYQKESLRIAKAKLQAGDVSELDVDQAESLLYNTMASVPQLEITILQLRNSMAVLLGKPPGEYTDLLKNETLLIPPSPEIAVGMPQDLLRRRADVRLAERKLASQSAQIGYAMTDLYPHLTIGGSVGTSAVSSSDLFTNDAKNWSIFGMFEWNIFNYGRLESNVRLQDALFQQLLVDYRNSVLEAQNDVENAIIAFLKTHEQMISYRSAAIASQKSVDVASIQYQEGSVDFNTLISTLSSNLQQQDKLAEVQGNVFTNLINVYKALGGGWEVRQGRDPVDLLPAKTKEEMSERTNIWNGLLK